MNIENNQASLEEILNITKNGYYTTKHRETVNLTEQIETMRQATRTFTTNNVPIVYKDQTIPQQSLPFVTIEEGTINQVIDFYLRESITAPNNVTVLNFASSDKVTQDWLNIMNTEEEALTNSSLVYASIYDKLNINNFEYGLLNAFYSYNVPIVRDKHGALVSPVYADIITVQEVDKLVTSAYKAFTQPRKSELRKRVKTIISEYVQNILERDLRDSVLIMGVYSCGPIGTHPISVATLFKLVLEQYESIFIERNIRVDFALTDVHVLDTFRKTFNKDL